MYFKIKKKTNKIRFIHYSKKVSKKHSGDGDPKGRDGDANSRGPEGRGRKFDFRSRDRRDGDQNPEGRKGTGTQNRRGDASRNNRDPVP